MNIFQTSINAQKILKFVIIFSINNYVNIAYYHPGFSVRSFFRQQCRNVKYEKKNDLQNERMGPWHLSFGSLPSNDKLAAGLYNPGKV